MSLGSIANRQSIEPFQLPRMELLPMALMDDADLHRPTPRFGSISDSKRLFLLLSLSLIVVSGVRRATDDVFPQYFIDLVAGQSTRVDPVRGFLFEGVLGDLIGYCFAWTHRDASTIAGAWWVTGVILLSWSTVHVCRSRRVSVETVCVLLVATHLIDTLLLWIGKLDGFLLAALLLSAHPDRRTSAIGGLVAAFLHPLIAVLSTAGAFLVMSLDGKKPPYSHLILVFAAACLDLAIFGHLFPEMTGRTGFVQAQFQHLLANGVNNGVPTLLAGFAAPLALAYMMIGQPKLDRGPISVLIGGWFVAVVLLTSFLIRDHTRVLCLITVLPLFLLASRLMDRDDVRLSRMPSRFLFCLLLIRLAIPYVDGSGTEMFEWGIVTRHLGPP